MTVKKTPIEAALFGLIHAEAEDRGAFFAETNGVVIFKERGYPIITVGLDTGREKAYRDVADLASIDLPNININSGALTDIQILQLGNEFVEGLQSANSGVEFSESESRAWCAGWNIATSIILKDEEPARAAVSVPPEPNPAMPAIDPVPDLSFPAADDELSRLLARKDSWNEDDYQKVINFEPGVSSCAPAHNASVSDEKNPEISGSVYISFYHGPDIQVEFSDRRKCAASNELDAWALAYRELVRRVEADDIPF